MPPNLEVDRHHIDHKSLDPIEYEDIDEQSINDQPMNNASSHDSQSSTNKPKDAAPTFLTRLSQLPMQRFLPWRDGQELPPERSTGSPRVQQRGACLLVTRGNVNDKPCDHCAAGLGRFTQCITLGNWFQGACSSCIFTSKGNRCSSRLQKGKMDGRKARHQLAEDGGMIEEWELKPMRKRKRWTPARDQTIVSIINKTLGQSPTQPTPITAAPTTRTMSSKTTMQPLSFTASPQRASQDIDSLLQAEIEREERAGLLGYVHKMEKKQTRVLSSPLSAGPTPPPLRQDHYLQFPPKMPTAGGGSKAQNDGGQPVPLIDTLSRSKQRQIFGLISGMQGGIDRLQKQLNLLQTSMGIEPEDSKLGQAV